MYENLKNKRTVNTHYPNLNFTLAPKAVPHDPLYVLRGDMFSSPRPVQCRFMCGTPTCATNGSCDVSVWVLLHLTPQLSSVVVTHTSNMLGSAALLRYATTASHPHSAATSRGVLWWKQKYNKATQLQQSDWHQARWYTANTNKSLNLLSRLHIQWI